MQKKARIKFVLNSKCERRTPLCLAYVHDMHHSTWHPHPQPPFGYAQPHGNTSCFVMGLLCCQLMRRTNQNYLHLQKSHWICIGQISKTIPPTYRKGCTTTHTNALEMRAKHACNSYKCITRLIVTGTRHHYAGRTWSCTNFVHSVHTARAQRAKRPLGLWRRVSLTSVLKPSLSLSPNPHSRVSLMSVL